MKYLISSLLLLAGIACNAQGYQDTLNMINKLSKKNLVLGDSILFTRYATRVWPVVKFIKLIENDTLIISPSTQYKFIKIGDRVYKINAPTLTEVQESTTLSSGISRWYNGDTSPLSIWGSPF